MAKRAVNDWPMVAGTLRSAAFEAPEEIDRVWGTVVHTPLVVLCIPIWLLIQLISRFRVRFLYTYEAGARCYVGYDIEFVWNRSDTLKLFGWLPGEKILVRYDPQAPGTSVVLAEDNPR